MKINFKEDKQSLNNRINIHSKFGQKDMVKWVSSFLIKMSVKKFYYIAIYYNNRFYFQFLKL